MILTVTLNAALDVTCNVDALVPHGSHRVDRPFSRAGGKGVEAARVLSALGVPAAVPCPLAGDFDVGLHEQFRTSVAEK
ncbi:tagatose 6-phosphate kinase [Streptomyces sp. BpilaLS-43]|nr:tagatose 6-phosphate kinase [Streptomyces sp. BpilaLS-43]